jgi:hypothetical protein
MLTELMSVGARSATASPSSHSSVQRNVWEPLPVVFSYCRREGRAAVQQAAVVAVLTTATVVYSYRPCRRRASAAVPQTAAVQQAAP